MKRTSSVLFRAAVLLFCLRSALFAITWDFTSGTGSPSGMPEGITGGLLTVGNQAGGTIVFNATTPADLAGSSGGINAAIRTVLSSLLDPKPPTYFQFTLEPEAGYYIKVTGLSLNSRRTPNGPARIELYSSADNFLTLLGSPQRLADASKWTSLSFTQWSVVAPVDSSLTFRLYGCESGTASSATWRIDDVSLDAVGVAAVPDSTTHTGLLSGLAFVAALIAHRKKLGRTQNCSG